MPTKDMILYVIFAFLMFYIALFTAIGSLYKITRPEILSTEKTRPPSVQRSATKKIKTMYSNFYTAIINIKISLKRMIVRKLK